MVNRLFVFHGDLGAAKNILKNIVLLSPQVHFPVNAPDRLEYFQNRIYVQQSINDWFRYEYHLKDYEKFGMPLILGDVDVDSILQLPPAVQTLLATKNYALDLFNKERANQVVELPWCRFLMIYPQTEQALRWQVRAYTTKKKPEQLHNFTYCDQSLIDQHQVQYGMQSWIKVNTYNFYCNVRDYAQQLKTQSWPSVPLEWILYSKHWDQLIDFLITHFEVEIDHARALQLLQCWTNLHWPVDTTDLWEHVDIFDGYRTEFSDHCIKHHVIN
jgi:hypothetical protein